MVISYLKRDHTRRRLATSRLVRSRLAASRLVKGLGAIVLTTIVLTVGLAHADEPPSLNSITFERDGKVRTLAGRVVMEGGDGGVLLETRDTVLWLLQPAEIKSRTDEQEAFSVLSQAELMKELSLEFPGFETHQTANYLIVHNTSRAYAEWCGGLYERLHRAFINYWKTRGVRLTSPKHPMVALVFRDQRAYEEYAVADIGPYAKSILGYYNIQANRVVMFDLTGVERATAGSRSTADQINQVLLQPAAERQVATIVHEATHQISYNCGLQTRLAGHPKWVSEGMAIFFETPDLRSRRGWAGIGKIHPLHLANFRNRNSGPGMIRRIVTDDSTFLQPETAGNAYSEAWALTYYLQKAKTREYVKYIRGLSELPSLAEEEPDQRLARFRASFGGVADLEKRFLIFMQRLQ
jgi:hypothetical protein